MSAVIYNGSRNNCILMGMHDVYKGECVGFITVFQRYIFSRVMRDINCVDHTAPQCPSVMGESIIRQQFTADTADG